MYCITLCCIIFYYFILSFTILIKWYIHTTHTHLYIYIYDPSSRSSSEARWELLWDECQVPSAEIARSKVRGQQVFPKHGTLKQLYICLSIWCGVHWVSDWNHKSLRSRWWRTAGSKKEENALSDYDRDASWRIVKKPWNIMHSYKSYKDFVNLWDQTSKHVQDHNQRACHSFFISQGDSGGKSAGTCFDWSEPLCRHLRHLATTLATSCDTSHSAPRIARMPGLQLLKWYPNTGSIAGHGVWDVLVGHVGVWCMTNWLLIDHPVLNNVFLRGVYHP